MFSYELLPADFPSKADISGEYKNCLSLDRNADSRAELLSSLNKFGDGTNGDSKLKIGDAIIFFDIHGLNHTQKLLYLCLSNTWN